MVEVVGHIEGIIKRENGNPFSKKDAELVYSVLREYGFEFSGSFAQAVGVTVPTSGAEPEDIEEDTPLILAIKSLIELKKIYGVIPNQQDYTITGIEIDPDEDVKLIMEGEEVVDMVTYERVYNAYDSMKALLNEMKDDEAIEGYDVSDIFDQIQRIEGAK